MAFKSDYRQILRGLGLLALALVPSLAGPGARAHEDARPADGPATRFEQFLLSGCVRCVTEAYLVATLPTGAAKLSGLPKSGGAQPGRAGEIRVEALRAYTLGRPGRQLFAVRMTLSVAVGAGGELYRVAAGLVDEDELAALSAALSDIARLAAAARPDAGAELTNASVRGGSLRIGLLKLRGESAAYAQAAEPSVMALRAVWDVPATIYLPSEQLPALASAVGEAATKIRQLRGT
ncbi:MAG TPA: hypothetical protein VKD25_02390 [Burkholderiales bacterium]|nr:hypothetical protein [Burkholderiales bacterium]